MKKILFLLLFSLSFGQITSLEDQTIGHPDSTFKQLLRFPDNGGVGATLKRMHDGVGDTTALYISIDSVKVAGVFQATSIIGEADPFFLADVRDSVNVIVDSTYIDGKNFVPDLEQTTHTSTVAAHHTATVSGDISHDGINDVSTSDHHAKTVSGDISHDAINDVSTSDHHIKTVDSNLDSIGIGALGFVPDLEFQDSLLVHRTAIDLNSAKVTNVSTDLSEGTSTETTVDISSSDGTNATLVSASTLRAGVLTKAKWDEIVANSLKATNTDDQVFDVSTLTGNTLSLSLEDDGEATKTFDISSTTAVTANTAKVTYVQNVRDGGVSISTAPSDMDFLGADFEVIDTGKPDSVNISIVDSGIDHDQTTNYVGDEHIDWKLSTQGTIHATNYVDNNTQLDSSGVDALNFVPDLEFATHKTSADHDGRYYTETEVDNIALTLLLKTAFDDSVAEYIDDTAYNATSWDANTDAATKNAIRDKVETMDIAIGLNTSKVTNVSTNLSEGTSTETTVDVNSSDGTNATLVSASTSRAGLLTKAKWDEIVASTTHSGLTNDPHSVTATQVGLGNVDNLSNANQVSVGAVNSGSITSGFGAIDIGSDNITSGNFELLTDYSGDLETAVSAIGATETTLIINMQPDALVNDLTIPATLDIQWLKGYPLADTGVDTLTINSSLDAGFYQIFGDDLDVAGSPKVEYVVPQWFGAVGDSLADETAALQKTINFSAWADRNIFIPSGDYIFSRLWFNYDVSNNPGFPTDKRKHGNMKFYGAGATYYFDENHRTILHSSEVTNPCIVADGTALSAGINGLEISDLRIEQTNTTQMMALTKINEFTTLENVILEQAGTGGGILVDGCWRIQWEDVLVLGASGYNSRGITIYNTIAGAGLVNLFNVNSVSFAFGIILGHDTFGSGLLETNISAVGLDFSSADSVGLWLADGIQGFSLIGGSSENVQNADSTAIAIKISNDARNVTIQSTSITRPNIGIQIGSNLGTNADRVRNILIDNNYIGNILNTGMKIYTREGSENIVISNNRIHLELFDDAESIFIEDTVFVGLNVLDNVIQRGRNGIVNFDRIDVFRRPGGATTTNTSSVKGLIEAETLGSAYGGVGEYENLLIYSEEFNQWSASGGTLTANNAIAPDGTLTADKFVPSAIAESHNLLKTTPAVLAADSVYTFSVYVKDFGYDLYMRIFQSAATTSTVFLRTGDGQLADNTGTEYIKSSSIPIDNGWFRFSTTFTSTGAATINAILGVFTNTPANVIDETFVGDGSSGFYIWGAQLVKEQDVGLYVKSVATAIANNSGLLSGGNLYVDGDIETGGSMTSDNDVTGATVAGITAANLVDKSAVEAITGDWTFDGNHPVEGYPTGRNVIRSLHITIIPGGTPNTNITCSSSTTIGRVFNPPSVTTGTNLAKSGTEGSFSLDATGAILTIDLTETVLGVLGHSIDTHDINSSSTTELYTIFCYVDSGNLIVTIKVRPSQTDADFIDVIDSGDKLAFKVSFMTST